MSIISVTKNKHRKCNQILGKTESGTPFITKWAPQNIYRYFHFIQEKSMYFLQISCNEYMFWRLPIYAPSYLLSFYTPPPKHSEEYFKN